MPPPPWRTEWGCTAGLQHPGLRALALEVIEDVDLCVSVAVSAAKKNPYFDRHEFWTKEHWDETFDKEFPTYNRGFIGAVED